MKKNLSVLSFLIWFASCSDDALDVTPTDQLTDETVWSDPETADLFLNDIYGRLNPGPWSSVWTNLPTEISNDPLENYSDNSIQGNLNSPSYTLFADGSYDPSNLMFDDQWKNMYADIRTCNLFIEKVSAADFEEAVKNGMIAQARFLRAYFYKSLIDLYGGVPLITEVLDRNNGKNINYPRSSYEECVDFIRQECTEAAADMPVTAPDEEAGRATWGAAMAMKGEMELYAGKWQEAAATHQEIIESGVYELFPDYETLFHMENENNEEVIFDVQYEPVIRGTSKETYWGVIQQPDGFGWGALGPTQNLVDSYEFTDGKTVAEGSARYDPDHPYENRDQRFYASVIYDGCEWRGQTVYTRLGISNNRNQLNITAGGNASTRTGYYVRKMVDPDVVPGRENLDSRTGGTNYIIFRYAEVLLNYAEAKNELAGPDAAVYDAMNRIRSRAGQPELPAGLDQEAMRERIRRERRIELAFEGKRFYDIRRWGISEQVFSEPMYAMEITGMGGKLSYEKKPAQTTRFDASKNYLMPIPQYAIDQNPELKQNPGY